MLEKMIDKLEMFNLYSPAWGGSVDVLVKVFS